MPFGQQVLGRDLASEDIVDHDARQRRMADVDEHGGEALALQARDLGVGGAQRHDQQAVDAVAAGEVAEGVGPLRERLDVEQQQVVLAVLDATARRPRAVAPAPSRS